MTFFANNFKHRQFIYFGKAFFVTSMNSGSLPQNKALFSSDLVVKFRMHEKKSTKFSSDFHRAKWVQLERSLNEGSKNGHVG